MIHDMNVKNPFPGENDQPQPLKDRHIFNRKALSMVEGYYDRVWRQLAAKVQLDPNEEVKHRFQYL